MYAYFYRTKLLVYWPFKAELLLKLYQVALVTGKVLYEHNYNMENTQENISYMTGSLFKYKHLRPPHIHTFK